MTKYELLHYFMHFCRDMGKKCALGESEQKNMAKWVKANWFIEWVPPCEIVSHRTVGAWLLDYAGCYGGWQIQKIDSEGVGICCPLGHKRFKTIDLYFMICFARESLRLKQGGIE
jgi:hypothetical protein